MAVSALNRAHPHQGDQLAERNWPHAMAVHSHVHPPPQWRATAVGVAVKVPRPVMRAVPRTDREVAHHNFRLLDPNHPIPIDRAEPLHYSSVKPLVVIPPDEMNAPVQGRENGCRRLILVKAYVPQKKHIPVTGHKLVPETDKTVVHRIDIGIATAPGHELMAEVRVGCEEQLIGVHSRGFGVPLLIPS